MHAKSPRPARIAAPLLSLLAGVLLACGAARAGSPPKLTVIYPQQEATNSYPVQVLRLALREAGLNYTLRPSDRPMPQGRALQQLAEGSQVTVVWSMTSTERERELRPIRIPIDKGLLGWRVFLINKDQAASFARIKTLDDLRKLQAGQGHDWPDTEILRANGLLVQAGTSYDGLFRMLTARRFDYFPRSITEVWDEQKAHAQQDIEIEQTLILHYPTAYYFFVNKKDQRLARAIEGGLNKAIANGKFEQLFTETYGDMLLRVHLAGRTRINLRNPLLPPATPLDRKALWVAF